MSGEATRLSDYCSVRLRTEPRPNTDETPLAQYRRKGYAVGDGDEAKALDAAVALTASSWGPPFDTAHDDPEAGEWWFEAYEHASLAVESAIVDALTGGDQ